MSGVDVDVWVGARVASPELAALEVAGTLLDETVVDDLLSPEGFARAVGGEVRYRKYVAEAYSGGVVIDRYTFVCRYD